MSGEEAGLGDIAIVGMAGRFPKSPDVEHFWQNLRDGVECVRFFSEEELIEAGVDPALARDPNYVPAQGWLDDIDLFDAEFFDMSPREAEVTDPQFRFFLECAWEALENAGYEDDDYVIALVSEYLGDLEANRYEKIARKLGTSVDEIVECHMVAGGFDYLLKVQVADMAS